MKNDTKIDCSRTSDLTIEEIKACSLFSHLTDQEAEEVIRTLKIFTKIVYDFYKHRSEKS